MNQFYHIFLIFIVGLLRSSFAFHGFRKLQRCLHLHSAEDNAELSNYLSGTLISPWKGSRDILKRKKQVPDSSYNPQKVVMTCLNALAINDDPQLDHGCCVLLEFKSPNGPLSKDNLDPASYGRFLRSSEYGILIDHRTADLIGEPEQLMDSLSVVQKVKVTGWREGEETPIKFFDFYLTKVTDTWLIDVVLLSKPANK